MKISCRIRCRGFTLVEAIVATTVTGLSLVAALGALHAAMTAAGRSADLDRAVLLAEGRLSEVLAGPVRELSTRQGQFTGQDAKFHFEVTLRPATAQVGLAEVRVRIMWASQGQPRSYQLLTLQRVQPVGRQ